MGSVENYLFPLVYSLYAKLRATGSRFIFYHTNIRAVWIFSSYSRQDSETLEIHQNAKMFILFNIHHVPASSPRNSISSYESESKVPINTQNYNLNNLF